MVVSNCGNPETENGLESNDNSESPDFFLNSTRKTLTDDAERPGRSFQPFVLWWSTMTSSVFQLLRRKHHSFSFSNRPQIISTTELSIHHEDQNNLAAGLNSVIQVDMDVPVSIDIVPSE